MKKVMAKVLAPAAISTAKVSTEMRCSFILNQPKMPAKLMNTVK